MLSGFADKDSTYTFDGKKYKVTKGEPLVTYSRGGHDNSFIRRNVPLSVYTSNSDGHTENLFYRYNSPNEVFLPDVVVTAKKGNKRALGGNLFEDGGSYSYTKPLNNVIVDEYGNLLDPNVPSARGSIRTPDIVITANPIDVGRGKARRMLENAFIESNDATATPYTTNSHLNERGIDGAAKAAAWMQDNPTLNNAGMALGATPFAVAGYPAFMATGEGAATALANPYVDAALTSVGGAHAAQSLANGEADWMTALELAPLGRLAKPLYESTSSIINSAYNRLPWTYTIPKNPNMAYRRMGPLERDWLMEGNELSTRETNALTEAEEEAAKAAAKKGRRFSLFKAGAEHGGRKQFAKGQPWTGTTVTHGEEQVLAIPGEGLPWVSGRHYHGPQGNGFGVGNISFEEAPFGSHIDLLTEEGYTGVNPSLLDGSVIYSPYKIFGHNFGYKKLYPKDAPSLGRPQVPEGFGSTSTFTFGDLGDKAGYYTHVGTPKSKVWVSKDRVWPELSELGENSRGVPVYQIDAKAYDAKFGEPTLVDYEGNSLEIPISKGSWEESASIFKGFPQAIISREQMMQVPHIKTTRNPVTGLWERELYQPEKTIFPEETPIADWSMGRYRKQE